MMVICMLQKSQYPTYARNYRICFEYLEFGIDSKAVQSRCFGACAKTRRECMYQYYSDD